MPKDYVDSLIKDKISGYEFIKNITSNLSNSEISNILNDKEYCLKFFIQSLNTLTNVNSDWRKLAVLFISQIVEDLFKISSKNLTISIGLIFNLFILENQLILHNYLHKMDVNHKNQYLGNFSNFNFKEPFSPDIIEKNHYISTQFNNLYVLINKNSNQQNHKNLIKQYISMHQLESKVTHF